MTETKYRYPVYIKNYQRKNENRASRIGMVNSVSDPDPEGIRIQSGQWIRIWNRIRIQEGKNDTQK
jgi:hypothetical protein